MMRTRIQQHDVPEMGAAPNKAARQGSVRLRWETAVARRPAMSRLLARSSQHGAAGSDRKNLFRDVRGHILTASSRERIPERAVS